MEITSFRQTTVFLDKSPPLLSVQNPPASCIYVVSLFYLYWLSVASSYTWQYTPRAMFPAKRRNDETTNQRLELRKKWDLVFGAVDQRQFSRRSNTRCRSKSAYRISANKTPAPAGCGSANLVEYSYVTITPTAHYKRYMQTLAQLTRCDELY